MIQISGILSHLKCWHAYRRSSRMLSWKLCWHLFLELLACKLGQGCQKQAVLFVQANASFWETAMQRPPATAAVRLSKPSLTSPGGLSSRSSLSCRVSTSTLKQLTKHKHTACQSITQSHSDPHRAAMDTWALLNCLLQSKSFPRNPHVQPHLHRSCLGFPLGSTGSEPSAPALLA